MSMLTFKVGKVTIENTEIHYLENATLTINVGEADLTAIGDSWNDVAALAKNWGLTLACKYNNADTVQAAVRTEFISGDCLVSTVAMWEDASHYFSGSGALISGCTVTKAVGAQDKLSITLKGKGALSYD